MEAGQNEVEIECRDAAEGGGAEQSDDARGVESGGIQSGRIWSGGMQGGGIRNGRVRSGGRLPVVDRAQVARDGAEAQSPSTGPLVLLPKIRVCDCVCVSGPYAFFLLVEKE